MKLKERVAIVFGGTSGLGEATAKGNQQCLFVYV